MRLIRPRSVVFVAVAAGVLLALVAVGWVFVSRRRAEQEDRAIAALKARLETGGGGAEEQHRAGLEKIGRQEGEEGLARLELAAERAPEDLHYGNDLRLSYLRLGQFDRSIRFFERLSEKNGALPAPRLQLALAYVDKMPDHMMGIVGQGKLSKQSIAQLTRLLDPGGGADETRWAMLYALGMNHLYWPKALRHAPAAVEAFRGCLDQQKAMTASGSSATRPYFVLCDIGLGDALVKDGRHAEARAVWREAERTFPGETRLAERLAIEDDARLTEFVDTARGLGIAIDTDLSILWGRKP